MPRYLHIPHTPDTARTQTLSGRNYLVVSGIVTHLKSTTGAEKGAEVKSVHKARRSPTTSVPHIGMAVSEVNTLYQR